MAVGVSGWGYTESPPTTQRQQDTAVTAAATDNSTATASTESLRQHGSLKMISVPHLTIRMLSRDTDDLPSTWKFSDDEWKTIRERLAAPTEQEDICLANAVFRDAKAITFIDINMNPTWRLDALRVQGKVNDNPCEIILDTGTAFTVIGGDLATKISATVDQTSEYKGPQIQVANGEHIVPTGTVVVIIQIGPHTFRTRAVLAKRIPFDILLGNDFLQESDACIQPGRKQISFGTSPLTVPCFSARSKPLEVALADDVTLAPHATTVALVVIHGVTQGEGIIKPIEEVQQRFGVTVCDALVKLDNSRQVVPMHNSSNFEAHIAKGQVVAILMPHPRGNNHRPETMARDPLWREDGGWTEARQLMHALTVDWDNIPVSDIPATEAMFWEHRGVFARDEHQMGRTATVQHPIETGDSVPITLPLRCQAQIHLETIDSNVEDMKCRGVIRDSDSPWNFPVVLVKKKDGSVRFCIDYRQLNSVTKRDNHPLPNITELLDSLADKKIFSTMDLMSGYWQVDMAPEDIQKTAFSTRTGHYEFTVMPFGLCNAPATFQRLMYAVTAGLEWNICKTYLDDVLSASMSTKQHAADLAQIFDRLRQHGLRLKPTKCKFFMKSITFLGSVISSDGLSPDPAKTAAIKDFPKPNNATDVRSFLGLTNYYCRFIKDFAMIAAPLNDLTRKDIKFAWTSSHEAAFNKLKMVLASAPMLAHPKYDDAIFIVTTDASDIGMGAILSLQQQSDERPVAFASKAFNAAEKNYSATEKECKAVVWALDTQFRTYVLGRHFILKMDHSALIWLSKFKEPAGKIARWIMKLQEYDYNIRHVPGRHIPHVDSLSRHPVEQSKSIGARTAPLSTIKEWTTASSVDDVESSLQTCQLTTQRLIEEQTREESLDLYRSRTEAKQDEVDERFFMHNGILMRHGRSTDPRIDPVEFNQIVLPASLRAEVLQHMHSSALMGHLGVERTLDRILSRFWWPGVRKDTQHWLAACMDCQAKKPAKDTKVGRLSPIPVKTEPFYMLGFDILGPLPKSASNKKYILVYTDYFTKWVEADCLEHQDAQAIADSLVVKIILQHGAPFRLLSDRGRAFMSKIVGGIQKCLGIERVNTTAYHPQTDGLTERCNRTLVNMLAKFVNRDQDDWDVLLPYMLFAYNTSKHATTHYTPFFLVHGREATLPIDVSFPRAEVDSTSTTQQYATLITQRLRQARQFVDQNIQVAQTHQADAYDQGRVNKQYEVDDKVWIYSPHIGKEKKKKLSSLWHGPYTVVRRINDLNYVVRLTMNPVSTPSTVHVARLKPFMSWQQAPETIPYVRDEQQADALEQELVQEFNRTTRQLAEGQAELPCRGQEMVFQEAAQKVIEQSVAPTTATQNSEGDDESQQEYEVEEILNHKLSRPRKGVAEERFLIKWRGYDKPTWEPADNLRHCAEKIEEYRQKVQDEQEEEQLQRRQQLSQQQRARRMLQEFRPLTKFRPQQQ